MSRTKAVSYRISGDASAARVYRTGMGGTVNDTPVGPVYCSYAAAALAVMRAADGQGFRGSRINVDKLGWPFIVAAVHGGDTVAWNFEAALPADPCEHRNMVEQAMSPTVQPFDVPDGCDDAAELDYDLTEVCDDAAEVLYWECRECERKWHARRAGDLPAMLADIATARRNLAGQP